MAANTSEAWRVQKNHSLNLKLHSKSTMKNSVWKNTSNEEFSWYLLGWNTSKLWWFPFFLIQSKGNQNLFKTENRLIVIILFLHKVKVDAEMEWNNLPISQGCKPTSKHYWSDKGLSVGISRGNISACKLGEKLIKHCKMSSMKRETNECNDCSMMVSVPKGERKQPIHIYIYWLKIQIYHCRRSSRKGETYQCGKTAKPYFSKKAGYSGKDCLHQNEFHASLIWCLILPCLLPQTNSKNKKQQKSHLRKGLLDLWPWNKKQRHE